MKNTVRTGLILFFSATLLLSGCAGVGPATVARDRSDYTVAIGDSWKSQMLLNMVKLRYGDAPIFLDVASVISQYEVQGTVNLGASWSRPPYLGSQTIGAQGTYSDRPTITYSPLTGERFARSLMTPIPPSAILNLVQAGYPIDLVFRICVQSINGIQNRYGGSARAHAADLEFYPLLEKMVEIQAREAMGMRIQKIDNREAIVLLFRGKVDPATEAAIADVRRMLGLDPAAREFKVIYDSVATSDKEIAILSRSMLGIINDLAANIEVPDVHVTEKRVNPTFKDEPTVGVTVPPLLRVLSAPQRPADAFVSVYYRNHWFWIDDRDLMSKQLFSFLMFMFTLTETGGKEGAPIVTVPTR